ncbi:MAG: hypothetical protein ACXWYS_02875 [Gaiellaceae bacterium]
MANVAAGAYVISAKTIADPSASNSSYVVTCTLFVGSTALDSAEFSNNEHTTTLTLIGTHTFAATGSIVLRCRSTDSAVARVSKIYAIKVDSTTRAAVSG